MTITYILIGDSQGVGLRDYLRNALSPHGYVETGAAVQVGISTQRQISGGIPRRGLLNPNAEQLGAIGANLVIIVLGGNDTPGRSYTRTLRRLVELMGPVQGLRRPTPIVWVGPADTRGAPHPAGFYTTPANEDKTRSEAEERQVRVIARKSAAAVAQQRYLPTIGVTWLDGTAMTLGLEHRDDGLHFRRLARRTWAQRIAREVRRLGLRGGPPSPIGPPVAALAQVAENDRVNSEARTETMQATPRAGLYNAANINTAARQTAIAGAASRRADMGRRALRLPVVINALGFDFSTGLWVNSDSSNSTATEATVTTVPDNTEDPPPDEVEDDDDPSFIDTLFDAVF